MGRKRGKRQIQGCHGSLDGEGSPVKGSNHWSNDPVQVYGLAEFDPIDSGLWEGQFENFCPVKAAGLDRIVLRLVDCHT